MHPLETTLGLFYPRALNYTTVRREKTNESKNCRERQCLPDKDFALRVNVTLLPRYAVARGSLTHVD
jgi:hypothetical protein